MLQLEVLLDIRELIDGIRSMACSSDTTLTEVMDRLKIEDIPSLASINERMRKL